MARLSPDSTVNVKEAVTLKVRVEGDTEQAPLATAAHARSDIEKRRIKHLLAVVDNDLPVLQRDEQAVRAVTSVRDGHRPQDPSDELFEH